MSVNGSEKINSSPNFDREKVKPLPKESLKKDEEALAKGLTSEPKNETQSFEEIFPNGIYSPELYENNEIYKDDPYKAPKNTAAFLGRKYMAELYKLPQTVKIAKLLSKIEDKIQEVYNIKSVPDKELGVEDSLLKEVFKDKKIRAKWVEENPQYKNLSKLGYFYVINKLLNSGIFNTLKTVDSFFEEKGIDFPKMEETYTPEIMRYYKAKQEQFKEIQSNPFQKETTKEIKEKTDIIDESKKERQELQKAIALENSILASEENEAGRLETLRGKGEFGMEYIRKSLQDFSPENIEKHISDLKSGKLSETDKKFLVDAMLRYIYENKESFGKENYETIFSRFLNLATQIQNSEISPERSTETTIRYLNFMDGITKTKKIAKAENGAPSSPKFQTPLL